jgi:hypothetical protein
MSDYDAKHLRFLWTRGRGHDQTLEVTTSFLRDVVDEIVDASEHLDFLEDSLERHFDGDGGNLRLAMQAVRVAARHLAVAEAQFVKGSDEQLELRFRCLVMQARAYHRLGSYPKEALRFAYTARFELVKAAGGLDALQKLISSRKDNAVARHAMSVTGVYAAIVQRHGIPAARPSDHLDVLRAIGRAYVASSALVKYERTPALAAQLLYLLMSAGDPCDRKLVDDLYLLDVASRPVHARGQATVHLRDYAYAKYVGRLADAERHRLAAPFALHAFGLPRHADIATAIHFAA